MADGKQSRTKAYKERDAKFYDFRKIKVRKEWMYREQIKRAAEIAGESVNMFQIRAIVERARSLGVPFENGPFFDTESAETGEEPDISETE